MQLENRDDNKSRVYLEGMSQFLLRLHRTDSSREKEGRFAAAGPCETPL